jgi:hypothetical protein
MKQMILPTDPKERKAIPFVTGLIDYFPLALAEVAKTSYAGQQQHNPDKPLAWDKEKSKDHHDCIGRHLVDRGTFDTDGERHSAKLAWRALAALQIELEEAQDREKPVMGDGSKGGSFTGGQVVGAKSNANEGILLKPGNDEPMQVKNYNQLDVETQTEPCYIGINGTVYKKTFYGYERQE